MVKEWLNKRHNSILILFLYHLIPLTILIRYPRHIYLWHVHFSPLKYKIYCILFVSLKGNAKTGIKMLDYFFLIPRQPNTWNNIWLQPFATTEGVVGLIVQNITQVSNKTRIWRKKTRLTNFIRILSSFFSYSETNSIKYIIRVPRSMPSH